MKSLLSRIKLGSGQFYIGRGGDISINGIKLRLEIGLGSFCD